MLLPFLLFGNSINKQNQSVNDTPIRVPAGGNSWVVDKLDEESGIISNEGIKNWNDSGSRIRVYFRLPKSGQLNLGLNAEVHSGVSRIKCTVDKVSKEIELTNTSMSDVFVGTYEVKEPGYHFVELEGLEKSDEFFADVKDILLGGEATEGDMYFVKDDFYWGRRGPSVHLSYPIPDEVKEAKWFYNEITVPEGEDVIGSYYMANGFKNGYFGMQVNSETERRFLFSVWSPYNTQNPDEIPEEYKIKLLKKGKDVYSGKFGNEGSGGQSFLRYNWVAGTTYGFLLKGEPVGDNHSVFTAYFFAPEVGEWKIIASFKRPFTDSYLTNLYSFLENFHTETGAISRKALYTNQWICDTKNNWHELTKAKFTADATARKDARLDYAGGVENGKFFMKNCGFFNERTKIDTWFTKEPKGRTPDIDFSKLP